MDFLRTTFLELVRIRLACELFTRHDQRSQDVLIVEHPHLLDECTRSNHVLDSLGLNLFSRSQLDQRPDSTRQHEMAVVEMATITRAEKPIRGKDLIRLIGKVLIPGVSAMVCSPAAGRGRGAVSRGVRVARVASAHSCSRCRSIRCESAKGSVVSTLTVMSPL